MTSLTIQKSEVSQDPINEDLIVRLNDDPLRPGIWRAKCSTCGKILVYPAKHSQKKASCSNCAQGFFLP